MLGGRTNEQWIAQYASSHQHPVNRACHTFGIPLIAVSIALFVASIAAHRLWIYALALFLTGWTLQFIGHAIEGNRPAFFGNPIYFLVGPWWLIRRAAEAIGFLKPSTSK